MRVFLYELRKLFNWKVLLLILFISFLFYKLFLSFYFENFPNGRPAKDEFMITKEMINKYGHEMDEKEFQHFKNWYKQKKDEANAYLKSQQDAEKLGITTYEQFRQLDLTNKQYADFHEKVVFVDQADVFWELQAFENIIEQYESKGRDIESYTDEDQQERVKQIMANNDVNSVFPYLVYENYNELTRFWAVLIIISVVMVTCRVHITDRLNNAISLQYTTKTGRNLFSAKLLAALAATALITTVQIVIFWFFYLGNGTQAFFPLSINSFYNFYYFWFDFTFEGYIITTVIAIYIVAIVAALFSVFFSRIAQNYITLIGSLVPIVVLLSYCTLKYLVGELFAILHPLMLTIGTFLVLIAISTIFIIYRIKQEKLVDLI